MASAGSLMPLVQRPIALTFLSVAVLMLFYPLLLIWRRARIDRAAAQPQQLD
jgi:TctA family transporter